ncbi:1,3-propanediol dehydrogenase [Sporomusa carbonis]|uniref:iron-containing alcohol dehydrogenase n=1 Tax=Sporomusa carbonis TaxID=3076075 RepID=UPI003A73B708
MTNTIYQYKMPTELIFGRGAAEQVGKIAASLGAQTAMVVTDPGVTKAGLLQGIIASLEAAKINYIVFDQVESDPSTQLVMNVTEIAKTNNCNLIIGVGGGSALDASKAIAAMVTNPGDISEYAGIGKLKNPTLPVIAIPTTAGTGSEATYWSVLTNKQTKLKAGVGSWYLMPTVALADPLLTLSLPASLTASTGMDALTHAIESYVCTATQPISEAMSEKAIALIGRSLRKAVVNGRDIQAREDMLYASMIAALAFNVTRLGLAHAFVVPAAAYFPIPHGIGNAILLPHVMEFNYLACPEKFAKIAELMGEDIRGLSVLEAAQKSVTAVKSLMKDIGIIKGLRQFGVTENDLPHLAEEAAKTGNVPVNPRVANVQDIINIAQKALDGIA